MGQPAGVGAGGGAAPAQPGFAREQWLVWGRTGRHVAWHPHRSPCLVPSPRALTLARPQVIRLSFVLPPPGEGATLARLLTLACLLVDVMGSYKLAPGGQR